MKFRLKTHLKLLEGIALILALSAWALEWSSIQQWATASSDLSASIDSIQDSYSLIDLEAIVQLESAVNRATGDQRSQAEGPLSNYALAWKSPEVRHIWLRRTENTFLLLNRWISLLQFTESQNNLAPNQSLKDMSAELDRLKSELKKRLYTDRSLGPVSVPDFNLLQGVNASAVEERLGEIHSQLGTSINNTVSALNDKTATRSFIYRLIFILGGTLVVVGKVVEWKLELKADP